MNNTSYFDISEIDMKNAELERIEYLLTGGASIEEVMKKFSHYSKEEITKIMKRVEWFCFMSGDEAATRTVNGNDYIVRTVFSGESEKDIKTAILKLAERKTMREMGIEMPLEFEKDNTP